MFAGWNPFSLVKVRSNLEGCRMFADLPMCLTNVFVLKRWWLLLELCWFKPCFRGWNLISSRTPTYLNTKCCFAILFRQTMQSPYFCHQNPHVCWLNPYFYCLNTIFFCWNTNFCWWNHVNSPCFSQFSPFSPGEPRGFHSTGSHWPLQTLLHVRSMVSRWLSQLPWPNVGGNLGLSEKNVIWPWKFGFHEEKWWASAREMRVISSLKHIKTY